MLIGYARVSTHDQNLDLQQDALRAAGCEKVFVDELSGTSQVRPGLQQAIEALREGDVLVVWRLDRLGRSLRNLLDLVAQLEEKKVGFRSLQESMDTWRLRKPTFSSKKRRLASAVSKNQWILLLPAGN